MKFLIPIASRYGAILIQFALVTLIARELSTESAGAYFFISGLVLSLYFLTGFGIPDGLVAACPREVAGDRHGVAHALVARGLRYSILSALLIPSLLGVAVYHLYGAYVAAFSAAWLLGYCLIFIASQNLIAFNFVRSGSFVFYSAINVSLCLTTVPYLLFATSVRLDVTIAINAATALAAGAGSMIYAATKIRGFGASEGSTAVKRVWLDGTWMAAGRVVQAAIIWMPVWISGLLLSSEDAAHIGLASRLLGVVGAVLAAVRFSIRPQIARLAAENDWKNIETLDRKIALWATGLALAALFAVGALGDVVIPMVFGEAYKATSALLLIFLGASVAESLGGPVDEILKMTGNAKTVLAFQVASLLFMAGAGTFLVRSMGVNGIALAFSLAFLLLYGGQIAFLYRARRILAFPLLRSA